MSDLGLINSVFYLKTEMWGIQSTPPMNAEEIKAAIKPIHPEWRPIVLRPLLSAALAEVGKLAAVGTIHPPAPLVFRAFWDPPVHKVVLVGQDPYPNDTACGLSFSSYKMTPSQRPICALLDLHGSDLTAWTDRCLLLNMALTCVKSKDHVDAWTPYMISLVGAIDEFRPSLVWILLGAKAQELAPHIKKGTVLKWGHPSPLNPYNQTECPQSFKYCPCFAQAEQLITARGEAFNWRLEPLVKTPDVPVEVTPDKVIPEVLPAETIHVIDQSTASVDAQSKPLYIFTDGGCWGNGKETARGAWAWILTDLTDVIASDSGLLVGKATNQRAELMAIIMALEANRDSSGGRSKQVTIISDSEYSILTFTKWHKSWSAKKWTTVANVDLIRRGLAVVDETIHTFKHVRGHQTKPATGTQAYSEWYYNDQVDKMCYKLLDS